MHINGEYNKCEGLWTREQGEEKSIIDYVITTKKDLNTIKIDEEKKLQGRNTRNTTM